MLFVMLMGLAQAVEPEAVTVTYDAEAVTQCTLLGDVEATSGWAGLLQKLGRDLATAKAQTMTAERAGDTLHVVDMASSYWRVQLTGTAYRCEPAEE